MTDEQVELRTLSNRSLSWHIDPRIFKLYILPTEKCNFRCVYCYEDFKIGRMPQPVVDGIKKLLENRAGDMKKLAIEWFGGEPLLAKDVVLDISQYAKKICASRNISFNSSMTTNGYFLDEELLPKLVDAGVKSFQVSLDGTEEYHDRTRVLANGRGTYQRILANLLSAAETDLPFRIIVRLHITKDNADDAVDAYNMLQKSLLSDKRFKLLIKGIEYLGGNRETKALVPDHKTLEAFEKYVQQNGNAKPALGPSICYAAEPNQLVVRANGTLAKCTVAFNSASNNLGRILPDGSLEIDRDKFGKWTSGFKTMSKGALECPANALNLWF